MECQVPKSLKHEHEELHVELVEATMETGAVGEAARAVSKALYPHFMKEEEYALPPLGILCMLKGELPVSDVKNVLVMIARLKAELSNLHEEHKTIVTGLRHLSDAARQENKQDYAQLAHKFVLHAQMEEEVLYPAVIMIGEYLKNQFAQRMKHQA